MKKQKAFTLVELLVVISIIALLLSILMPSLGKAREQAKRMVCGAHQRQITLAAMMYAQENNNLFPAFNSHYSRPGSPLNMSCYLWETSLESRQLIRPYIESGKIFFCPSNRWRKWEMYEDYWDNGNEQADCYITYLIIFGDHPNVDSPDFRFLNYSSTGLEQGTYPVKNSVNLNSPSSRVLVSDIFDEGYYWETMGMKMHNHLTKKSGGEGSYQGYADGHVAWKRKSEMEYQFYMGVSKDWW